ncbi:Hpt domain-containing protein [Dongia sp. agr-C8]
MRGLGSGAYAGATADMVAGLLAEFLGEAQERAADLVQRLPKGDCLPDLRRFIFDLAGQARNFGLSMLETVADQAQNYLTAIVTLDDRAIDDLGAYLDVIQDLLSGKKAEEGDIRQMVRGLPVRRGVEIDEAPEARDIEVVLVMTPGTQQTFVERELRACGYRATAIPDTLKALAYATRAKPDMMIVSAVMPQLSGIDLALALSAIPATRNIPVAVITSLNADDPQLKVLPPSVCLIRKTSAFGDDLTKALQQGFLL